MAEYFKKESEHLAWLYNRLIKVHNESPSVDYMQFLKTIVNKLSGEHYGTCFKCLDFAPTNAHEICFPCVNNLIVDWKINNK